MHTKSKITDQIKFKLCMLNKSGNHLKCSSTYFGIILFEEQLFQENNEAFNTMCNKIFELAIYAIQQTINLHVLRSFPCILLYHHNFVPIIELIIFTLEGSFLPFKSIGLLWNWRLCFSMHQRMEHYLISGIKSIASKNLSKVNILLSRFWN